jgi:propionyl-CoA carboxylase beta chain
MGPEAAVNILFKDEIERAQDPEQRRKELIAEYNEKFTNPYIAASRGYIDEVIAPRMTRVKIINALEMLKNKRDTNPPKKHGNIPL